jgi:hypothetical protein
MFSNGWIWLRIPCLALGLVLTICMSDAPAALAQAPARTPAFVYGITYFGGQDYGNTMVPPGVNTIYLTAGIQSIVAPRQTLIYFWPVTNQYLADWETMNELVAGSLEIYRNGRLFQSVQLTDYIIQYDQDDPADTLKLSVGSDAKAADARFQELQKKNNDDQTAYYQAEQAWQDKMDALLQSLPADKTVPPDQLPKEPTPVPAFTLYSSQLEQGYLVSLPTGEYDLQMKRADGVYQPEGAKHLVVFDKEQDAVSYSVVPQSRWNKPETSNEPGAVIYALPDSTVYLESYRESRYNEYLYGHMIEPQDVASRADRGKWVVFGAQHLANMSASSGNQTQRIPIGSYYVRQLPGSGMGYEVIPYTSTVAQKQSFEGYEIKLSAAQPEYTVRLLDDSGNFVAGSERKIMVLNTDRAWTLYVLAALPLVAGLAAVFARRRSTRRIKVEE